MTSEEKKAQKEIDNSKWNELDKIKKLVKEEEWDKNKEYTEIRNYFLVKHYPIVNKVAEGMQKKLKEVSVDELVSWGTEGLYRAIDLFDISLGNKFETYAIHKIRGAILDNIRKIDWVPRLVRQRQSKILKAKHLLECDLGREPTNEEMAKALDMNVDEYIEMALKANPTTCVSMFTKPANGSDEVGEIQIEKISTKDKHPLNGIIKEEMFKKLLGKSFVPLERKIIHMHYYGGLTMKDIAATTGYSESRISQMHAKILIRIKKKISLNPQYMEDLESIIQS